MQRPPLSLLSTELIFNILEFLPEAGICNVTSANRRMHHEINQSPTGYIWKSLLHRRKFLLRTTVNVPQGRDTLEALYYERFYKSIYAKYKILHNLQHVSRTAFTNVLNSTSWEPHADNLFNPPISVMTCTIPQSSLMCVKTSCTFNNTSASSVIACLSNLNRHSEFEVELCQQHIMKEVDKSSALVYRSYPHSQACLLFHNYVQDDSFYQIQHSVTTKDVQHNNNLSKLLSKTLLTNLWTIEVVGSGYVVTPNQDHRNTGCTVTNILQLKYRKSIRTHEFQSFLTRLRPLILSNLGRIATTAAT